MCRRNGEFDYVEWLKEIGPAGRFLPTAHRNIEQIGPLDDIVLQCLKSTVSASLEDSVNRDAGLLL
tara:strand:- start:168 stop:365 length:198 start_codon:yes stop_codon:yes gene_type:complete